jgi:hypothetical protein
MGYNIISKSKFVFTKTMSQKLTNVNELYL